jgi:hypothetical protein
MCEAQIALTMAKQPSLEMEEVNESDNHSGA